MLSTSDEQQPLLDEEERRSVVHGDGLPLPYPDLNTTQIADLDPTQIVNLDQLIHSGSGSSSLDLCPAMTEAQLELVDLQDSDQEIAVATNVWGRDLETGEFLEEIQRMY